MPVHWGLLVALSLRSKAVATVDANTPPMSEDEAQKLANAEGLQLLPSGGKSEWLQRSHTLRRKERVRCGGTACTVCKSTTKVIRSQN